MANRDWMFVRYGGIVAQKAARLESCLKTLVYQALGRPPSDDTGTDDTKSALTSAAFSVEDTFNKGFSLRSLSTIATGLASTSRMLEHIFALDIATYAVMSNHYRVVVPQREVRQWSTEEVL